MPAAIISRELNIRRIDTVSVASYHDYVNQGEMQVLKEINSEILDTEGEGVLIVDDLTDTGKTAAIVRAMLPKAHFATVYAKPKGRPLVDSFVTEVSQDTWIYFPWDLGFAYVETLLSLSDARRADACRVQIPSFEQQRLCIVSQPCRSFAHPTGAAALLQVRAMS